MSRLLRIHVLGIALFALLSGISHAQLDLPKGKGKPIEKGGVEVPPRARGDLAPKTDAARPLRGSEKSGGALDLGSEGLPPETGTGDPEDPSSYDASLAGAARFIFDELAKKRSVNDGVAREAADSLAALGEAGLDGARLGLTGNHPPTLVVSARLLLRRGSPDDHRAVAERLARRMPKAAVVPMLADLVELDPSLATPGYLVALLDHPTTSVRAAAQAVLEHEVGPDHVPLLAGMLHSDLSDTRLRSVELAALVDDPAVLHLLVSRLEDRFPTVALRCAELLAQRDGEATVAALLDRAFPATIDRGAAYALLALILHEERTGLTHLTAAHAPALLSGMQSSEPMVIGTTAAALAGIGFRSPPSPDTAWLDLEVPHQLVRLATGVVFHRDFSSLQTVAPRRLTLISGKSFGADGPAWQRWWTEAAPTFRARRAVLEVGEGDEGSLEISYRAGNRPGDRIVLRGPDLPAPEAGELSLSALRFFVTARESAALVDVLRREGVFSAERMPDHTESRAGQARELEVTVHGQGKRFLLPVGMEAPWFERIANAVEAVAERNRWQLYPDRSRYPDDRSMWVVESVWWDQEHPVVERERRFVTLLLSYLRAAAPADRDAAVDELARLFAYPGVPQAGDMPDLLAILGDERFLGRRADLLVDLSLIAARTAGTGAVEASLGRGIIDAVTAAMGDRAAPAVARVMQASEPALVRGAATGEEPFLRAMSASVLAGEDDPESRALALALLEDPDSTVEAAATLALGRHRVEEARNKILLRARMAKTDVRVAALLAAGEMGGEGVLDVLQLGLYESDGRVQVAAAEGLASLADPASADILVRLLSQGSGTPFFEPAQRGLRAMGEAAWEELLRVSSSSAEATKRDASLLLAEQGVAAVTSNLITVLTKSPRDSRVAQELAVLTCVDFGGEQDPAEAWWGWWDTVVHDDSLVWLCAAAEREGVSAPPVAELGALGTRGGGLFLVRLLESREACVAERARRELSRMLEGDVGTAPPAGPLRQKWIDHLETLVRERLAARGQ